LLCRHKKGAHQGAFFRLFNIYFRPSRLALRDERPVRGLAIALGQPYSRYSGSIAVNEIS
jgi:hypothetical protein